MTDNLRCSVNPDESHMQGGLEHIAFQKANLDHSRLSESTNHLPCVNPVPGSALVLGTRDGRLLCDLLTYGAMLSEHVQALHFPGRTRRRMNQRLQQLCGAQLIARRPLPLGLSSHSPSPAPFGIPLVYSLGRRAAPLVSAQLGWDIADVRRLVRQGTPTALAHTLEIVALRIRAEHAVQVLNAHAPGTAMPKELPARLEFLPERLIRHSYQVRVPGGKWREELFKPDALLKLSINGEPYQHFFAETDLGHTSAGEWKIKAAIASRYQNAGLFEKRYGAAQFKTLICTTGERRRRHLQRLLEQNQSLEDTARFSLATLSDIADQGLMAPIWHVPGMTEPVNLMNYGGPTTHKDQSILEGASSEGIVPESRMASE